MAKKKRECKTPLHGRGERIRTSDLRYPKPSRYQAALRPDETGLAGRAGKGKPQRHGQAAVAPTAGWRSSEPGTMPIRSAMPPLISST